MHLGSFRGGGSVAERLRSPQSNVSNNLNLLWLMSDACAIWQHLGGTATNKNNTISTVEDGSGGMGELIGEFEGDEEMKNI